MTSSGAKSQQLVEHLSKLKTEVEGTRSQCAERVGELKALQTRLKEEFGVISIAKAKKALIKLGKEIAELKQGLNDGITKVEEMLE